MATAVVEQIAQALVTQLETIRRSNGYEVDVAEVVRPRRLGGFTPRDHQIVVMQEDPELLGEMEVENTMLQWVQPFNLSCLIRTSETEIMPSDQTVNEFRSDVEKAVLSESAPAWWAGLAVN